MKAQATDDDGEIHYCSRCEIPMAVSITTRTRNDVLV
jgi:hypothetical protein